MRPTFENSATTLRDNPSPGNIKGGLYNIYLKSTGVKAKGGTSIVEDLVEYGEWLGDRKGLYVLYTPGYDHLCTPALFLSGAQVALFTTGRGTGIGCALGPVMKIGTNPQLARTYADLDINAGTILERTETTEDVGRRIFQETLDVASGRKLRAPSRSAFIMNLRFGNPFGRRFDSRVTGNLRVPLFA